MFGRLIRQHLASEDKEAALYAYDSLLSAFPDNNVAPRIPARDWIAICEYLKESDMNREAAVEYERLVNACPDDPLVSRAAVQGGEAALFVADADRALKLFQKASPPHVKPLLYVFRVLLTGIHLMRTGIVEANLVRLNETAKLPYIKELIARKVGGAEKERLEQADM